MSSDSNASQTAVHVSGSAVVMVAEHTGAVAIVDGTSSAVAAATSVGAVTAHTGLSSTSGVSAQPAVGAAGALGMATALEGTRSVSTVHQADTSEAHQTLAVTPTSLEVGLHSGSQGWLKIRAEMGDQGDVKASLTAASAGGEQMLKGQLPALNAYLHSEQVSVTTSVAHGATSHSGGASLQAGTGSPAGQDTSLLQGGAGNGGAGSDARPQSGSGDASGVEGRDQSVPTYRGGLEANPSALPSTTLDGSVHRLNVTV